MPKAREGGAGGGQGGHSLGDDLQPAEERKEVGWRGEPGQARLCCSCCEHLGGSMNLAGALFDPATNLTEVR